MKRILFSFVLLFSLSTVSSSSYAFSSKGQDCSKCHKLNNDEAAALLTGFGQNIKVLGIRTSPFKAVWEVDIEADGKKELLYIDLTKKFIFAGSLLDAKERKNLTQERLSELNKVDVSKIPLSDALVLGDKNARNRLIVFDDPD